jgi:hypothetical protein
LINIPRYEIEASILKSSLHRSTHERFSYWCCNDPEKTAKTTFNSGSRQPPERSAGDQPCPNGIVDPKAVSP